MPKLVIKQKDLYVGAYFAHLYVNSHLANIARLSLGMTIMTASRRLARFSGTELVGSNFGVTTLLY